MCTAMDIFEEKIKNMERKQIYKELIRAMYKNEINIEDIKKITKLSENEITLYLYN